MLRSIRSGLRGLLRRQQVEQEVDDELAHFLAMAAEEHVRAGTPAEQALRRARVEMRGLTAAREEVLASGWEAGIDALQRDVRFAVRRLRRQPGLTAISVLTLALGLGAAATMASIVVAVDARALPFPDADRLVVPRLVAPCVEYTSCTTGLTASAATFDRLRTLARSYSGVAAVRPRGFSWMRDGEVDVADALAVTPGFFELLGRRPALGRGFVAADTAPGVEPVVVLGDSLWRAAFGGDPGVVGRRIALDPGGDGTVRHATVVGVMPPGFRYWSEAVWVAGVGIPGLDREAPSLVMLARLRPDVAPSRAAAELRLLATYRDGRGAEPAPPTTARVTSLRATYAEELGARRFLLLGIAAVVLAVAAVNIAALLLTRVAARRAEFAMLMALGARRAPLARQIVIEALLPVLLAGALGVLIARWATGVQARFLGLSTWGIPVPLDAQVLGACLLATLAVGVGIGVVAAFGGLPQAGERTLRATMTGADTPGPRRWLADGFVLAQLASAVVLVTSAALLTRELVRLSVEAPGFDPRGLHHVNVRAPDAVRDDPAQLRVFAREARARLGMVSGVTGAALGPTGGWGGELRIDGRAQPVPRPEQPMGMSVDEHYFQLLGTPARQGRLFTAADAAGSAPVAIVNEAAARQLWPGGGAVGQRLFFGADGGGTWATVVGVVPDTKVINASLRQVAPIIYRPYDQAPLRPRVFVRVRGDSVAVLADVRAALREITGRPTNRLLDIGSSAENFGSELASLRFTSRSLTAFALFGLLLAALGVFATVVATVTRRTREIGVRMALGATRRHVLTLVMQRAVRLAVVGLVIGVAASVASTRLLQSMLTMTSPTDPGVLAAAAAVLIAAVAVASYLPARRAARIAPVDAMRVE